MNMVEAKTLRDRFEKSQSKTEGYVISSAIACTGFLIVFVINGPKWAAWLALSIFSLGFLIFFITEILLNTLIFYEARYFNQMDRMARKIDAMNDE